MNNWYHDRPELDVLKDVRESLKDKRYNNIELWRLMGANVTLAYWGKSLLNNNKAKNLILFVYILLVRDIYKYFKSIKSAVNVPKSNPVFIEALSDESRVRDFWLPVAQKFGKEKCVLITNDIQVYNKYKNTFDVLIPVKFGFYDWIRSRFFLISNFKSIYTRFRKIQKINKLGSASALHLTTILTAQINLTLKVKWLYSKYHPKAYITIWDWYPLGAAFCSVKNYNIKSITYLHGAAGKQSYIEVVPLTADYVISWGKINNKHLEENGVKPTQILECGVQRMKIYEEPSSEELINRKKKEGIEIGKKTIGLFYTAQITSYWIEDTHYLFEKFISQFQFVCRPHPSTTKARFEQLVPLSERIHKKYPINISLEETIMLVDYVIVDSSTAGFDAICMNKIVIVLDSNPESKTQDVMLDVCDAGAAIFCKTVEQALQQIELFSKNSNLVEELHNKRKKFIQDYITAYDKEAIENIYRSITNLC